jgi:hypothetical protein
MPTCLNWNLPQVRKDFEELKSIFQDENVAYALLSRNKANNLDITPNGKVSKLFKDLLTQEIIAGDRALAMQYKAKIYSDTYLAKNNWIESGKEPTIDMYKAEFVIPSPAKPVAVKTIPQKIVSFLGLTRVKNIQKVIEEGSYLVSTPNKWKDLKRVLSMLSKVSGLFQTNGLFVHEGDEYIMKLNADLLEEVVDEKQLVKRVNEKIRKALPKKGSKPHNAIASKLHDGKRWLVTTDDVFNRDLTAEKHEQRRIEIVEDNIKWVDFVNKKFITVTGKPAISLTLMNPSELQKGLHAKYTVEIDNDVLLDYNAHMYTNYYNSMMHYMNTKDTEEETTFEDFQFSPVKNRLETELKALRKIKAQQNLSGAGTAAVHKTTLQIEDITDRLDKLAAADMIEDIINEAEIQFKEIDDKLKRQDLTPEDIESMLNILKFWMGLGSFNEDTHPILIEEDDFTNPDYREKFYTLKAKAEDRMSEVNKRGKNVFTNTVNQNIHTPDGTELSFSQITDVVAKYTTWDKLTTSLNRAGQALAQFIHKIVNEANDLAFKESKTFSRYFAELYDKMKKSGFDERLYLQREEVKTRKGMRERPTGRLVDKFSQKWFQNRYKFLTHIPSRKAYVIDLNPKLLFETTGKDHDAYMEELETHLGKIGLKRYVAEAQRKYNEYKDIENEFMQVEFGTTNATQLNNIQLKVLHNWQKRNSPIEYYNTIQNTKKTEKKELYGTDAFLVSVPRRFATVKGKQGNTGFYDKNFEQVENNPAAYEFYMEALNITNSANALFEGHAQFTSNSLAFVEATLLQKLMKHGVSNFLRKDLYDEMVSSLSGTTPKSTTLNADGTVEKKLRPGVEAIDTLIKEEFNKLKRKDYIKRTKEKISPPTEEELNEMLLDATDIVLDKMGMSKSDSNIFESLNILNSAALTFKHLSALQATVNLALTYLPESKMHTGDGIIDSNKNEVGTKYIQNLQEAVQHFLDTTYYKEPQGDESSVLGRIRTKEQREIAKKLKAVINNPDASEAEKLQAKNSLKELGNPVTINSIVRNLMNFIRLKALGWNLSASVVNLAFGTITNMYKAIEGRLYNGKEWLMAEKEVLVRFGKFNKVVENYHIIGDILYEFTETNKYQKKENYFFKTLKSLKPYVLQTNTEKKNQGTVMIAMLLHNKVKNTKTGEEKSFWDAINEQGKLSNEWQFRNKTGDNALIEVVSMIKSTIQEIHGDYTNNLMLKKTLAGRAVSMFRLWFFEAFHSRFASEKPDYIRGMDTKGRYITALQLAKEFKLNPIALWNAYKSNQLTEVDKANVRMNLAELATVVFSAILYALIKSSVCGDDDKKCKDANPKVLALMNMYQKLNSDLNFYWSPSGWKSFITNPTSLTSILGDMAKAFNLSYITLFGDEEDLIYKTGPNKDRSRWEVLLLQQIPIINQYERMQRNSEELLDLN